MTQTKHKNRVGLNQKRALHVYRTTISSPALPNGYGFQNASLFSDTDSVSPLAAPDSSIRIADLLPQTQQINALLALTQPEVQRGPPTLRQSHNTN